MSESPTPKRSLRNLMKRLLRLVFIAYMLVIILLGFFQRRLLYHPRKAPDLSVARFPDINRMFPAASDVSIRCEDGVTIRGWLLQKHAVNPKTDPVQRPLVIFFHGNAGNREGRVGWYHIFARTGADVLAIDYHGYGDSEGEMTESALEADSAATWKYATEELGYKPGDIILAGNSLGGAAAVLTAAAHVQPDDTPAGLMAVASFSSMVDVAGNIYPWLPVKAILVDRYPSDTRIPLVQCPVVILHGDEDSLIDQQFGRRLFDAAPENSADGTPKQWISMTGVNHNNVSDDGQKFAVTALTALLEHWRK
jgi:pimeloyl-ACP methyl ester carboxylesterase